MLLTPVGLAGIVSVGGIVTPPAPTPPLFEGFEPYAAGGLGSQGLWSPMQGDGNRPRIDVIAGSLMDGVNCLGLVDAGGTLAWGYVERALPAAITVGHNWKVSFNVLIPAGATGHNIEVDLLAGLVDPGYTKWSLGLVALSNGTQSTLNIYDRDGLTNINLGTLNVKIPLVLHVLTSGTFTIENPSGGILFGGVLFTGNEIVTEFSFSTDGAVPPGSAKWDSFLFEVLP